MDTLLKQFRPSQIRPWVASARRSRLGNVLVIANALYLARSALLQYSFDCPHTDCILVGDPIDVFCCFAPPLTTVLYNLAHLPTWLALLFLEWVVQPGWDQLCMVTARHIEAALFVWVSCAQWLFAGAFLEIRLLRNPHILAKRAELAHAAERAQREFVFYP